MAPVDGPHNAAAGVEGSSGGPAVQHDGTRSEQGCLHYAFSVIGNTAHCREGYASADAVLAHLRNVGELLGEALKIARILRLEVHAPASEVEKLKGPMASLNPQFFILEEGIRPFTHRCVDRARCAGGIRAA